MPSGNVIQDAGFSTVIQPPVAPRPSSSPVFPPCSSQIYCYGELLHTIQTAGIFNDSKTFVDMPSRFPPAEVLANYAQLPSVPSRELLLEFLTLNFFEPGSELQVLEPPDWVEEPPFLELIQQEEVRVWAKDVHSRWKLLYRRFNHSASCLECFSSIALPRPFVVPGGRFREPYYWDTYWVVKGLLVSGMTSTVKGMIENFIYMVRSIGFVPNGARIYYLNRSQPPYLVYLLPPPHLIFK